MTPKSSAETGINRIQLDGAVNCRDIGGYLTVDGRQVRKGIIYRSDQLADISDSDLESIQRMGLKTIVDFRSSIEQRDKPNRQLLAPEPTIYDLGFMPHRGDELIERTRNGTVTVQEIRAQVTEIYRDFVHDKTDIYTRLLALIVANHYPLLFHCTSGRDRTGFATALILSALGVPCSTIFSDYVLSDQFRRDLSFQMGNNVDPEVMYELTRSNPIYLQAAFDAIDDTWGGTDNYLREALKFSDNQRLKLQSLMLEPQ